MLPSSSMMMAKILPLKNSTISSVLLMSKSNLFGPSSLQKLSQVKIFQICSTSEELLQVLPRLQLQPSQLKRKLKIRRKTIRKSLKNSQSQLKKKKKTLEWEDSSIDQLNIQSQKLLSPDLKSLYYKIRNIVNQMGNEQTTQSGEQFYKQLKYVKGFSNSKLLMQDPTSGQFYVAIQSVFPSQTQALQYYQQLKKRIDPCHQYYLGPINYFIIINNNFCSKQFKAIQIYPYEEYTLREQIESREEEGNRHFDEKQIWSILCSCVLVMANFTRSEVQHLQLNPSDIILNSQGQVKVISYDLSEYQVDYNFMKGFYYAPETLKNMRSKSMQNHNNKAAVFSLGVTLLHALLLEDMSDLYAEEEISIDMGKLNNRLSKVESSQMKNILAKMLKVAPYQRISFTELEQMLYSILQSSEQMMDEEQIPKLKQSIYRISTESHAPLKLSQCQLMMYPNEEDLPNMPYMLEDTDVQLVDESEQQQTHDFTCNNTERGLTDKTNTYKDNSNQCEPQKSAESNNYQKQMPSYVNQQYSKGRYEGYKQFGMRHGFGTFHYEEGGRYSGQWKFNKMEGRGALYYSTGEIAYEGEWKNDKLHGYGVLYNESPIYITSEIDYENLDRVEACWVKYEGNFSEDQKNGQGALYLSNGEYYRGQFKDDQPNGFGTYKRTNGQIVDGAWQNGKYLRT